MLVAKYVHTVDFSDDPQFAAVRKRQNRRGDRSVCRDRKLKIHRYKAADRQFLA